MNTRLINICFACVAQATIASTLYAQDANRSGSKVEDAKAILEEVLHVYAEAEFLTDEMKTHFAMEGRSDQKSTIQVRINRSTIVATGIVPPQTLDVHAIGEFLYLQLKGVDGFAEVRLGEDPLATAKDVMGIAYPYLPPQVILRWAKDLEGVEDCFALGMLEECEIVGYKIMRVEQKTLHELTFAGSAPLLGGRPGVCRARFDSVTKLLVGIEIEGGTDGAEPTFRMTANCDPATPAKLETPIEFTASKNAKHTYPNFKSMLNVLLGGGTSIDPAITPGTEAPAFDLVDQSGRRHKSVHYLGKYVVLDWWGSWCQPCVRDLPKLQKLHEKYVANDEVVFLALNVRDRNGQMEQFWKDREFTFNALHDADELADEFGIKAYPSVVLIGPDGKVIHSEAGPASDIESILEKALDDAD